MLLSLHVKNYMSISDFEIDHAWYRQGMLKKDMQNLAIDSDTSTLPIIFSIMGLPASGKTVLFNAVKLLRALISDENLTICKSIYKPNVVNSTEADFSEFASDLSFIDHDDNQEHKANYKIAFNGEHILHESLTIDKNVYYSTENGEITISDLGYENASDKQKDLLSSIFERSCLDLNGRQTATFISRLKTCSYFLPKLTSFLAHMKENIYDAQGGNQDQIYEHINTLNSILADNTVCPLKDVDAVMLINRVISEDLQGELVLRETIIDDEYKLIDELPDTRPRLFLATRNNEGKSVFICFDDLNSSERELIDKTAIALSAICARGAALIDDLDCTLSADGLHRIFSIFSRDEINVNHGQIICTVKNFPFPVRNSEENSKEHYVIIRKAPDLGTVPMTLPSFG
ncbi:MAG: hypothetical protein J5934_07255 [Succinivibrio sp.]|nr:hypothetical protein [Succinivibrio sp.]